MDPSFYRTQSSCSDSKSESDIAITTLGIKPVINIVFAQDNSFKYTDTRQLSTSKTSSDTPLASPSSTTQPIPKPRTYSFEAAKLSDHELDEIKLSRPASPTTMEADDKDWDITETREEISAEVDSEDWEEIEAKVFDHATNTFKQIPSVVYEDEGFRQTLTQFMETYTEKCTPSYDTKCKFYSAMYLLKTVGEFGYLCVKEPLADWADQIALSLLEMPMDEASDAITAELLSFLPERTKMAFYRLRGYASSLLYVL
jgi:hypothetical protein